MNQLIEIPAIDIEGYKIEITDENQLDKLLVQYNGLQTIVDKVKKTALNLVADVTTSEGQKTLDITYKQIRKVSKQLDEIGKDRTAIYKDIPKKIDATRKSMRDQLEKLADDIRKPLTELETRQAQISEIAGLNSRISNCKSFAELNEIVAMLNRNQSREYWGLQYNDFLSVSEQAFSWVGDAEKRLDQEQKDREDLERLRAEDAKRQEQIRIDALANQKAMQLSRPAEDTSEIKLIRLRVEITDYLKFYERAEFSGALIDGILSGKIKGLRIV